VFRACWWRDGKQSNPPASTRLTGDTLVPVGRMSNAKCQVPHKALPCGAIGVTARPAAWQRGSAAALGNNENEGHSTLSARPRGLRSVPGMQRVWARAVPGACFGFIRLLPFSAGMCLERLPNADVLRQRSGVPADRCTGEAPLKNASAGCLSYCLSRFVLRWSSNVGSDGTRTRDILRE